MGVSALACAQARTDNDPAELKKFQGKWVMVSGKLDGKPVAAEQAGRSSITWNGNDTTVVTPHQAGEVIKSKSMIKAAKGSYGIIEFTRVNGPHAGKRTVAIYEFRGPDEYVTVFVPSGTDPAKEIDSKPGTGQVMHHWKRVKS
jgi:uncharacterized protein (TIGR03067 family)